MTIKGVRGPVSRVLSSLLAKDDHSSGTSVAGRLARPTRTATRKRASAVPIWSCSRWGLPCRLRRRKRGALLPHRFTLAWPCGPRRFHLCGAIPGVASAGRYPAPCFRGARTFLPPSRYGLRRGKPLSLPRRNPQGEDGRPSGHLTRMECRCAKARSQSPKAALPGWICTRHQRSRRALPGGSGAGRR